MPSPFAGKRFLCWPLFLFMRLCETVAASHASCFQKAYKEVVLSTWAFLGTSTEAWGRFRP